MWYISNILYNYLFSPNQNSKIQDKKCLDKKIIEILLNALFVLDDQETNEAVNREYADKSKTLVQ